jgi:hypothetical protein
VFYDSSLSLSDMMEKYQSKILAVPEISSLLDLYQSGKGQV